MNEAGNHGGSDPGENEATMMFASPKFRRMSTRKEYKCPTSAQKGTLYSYYDQVEQQDLVPTLSGLMGLPVPRNSIGKVLNGLRGVWENDESYVNILEQNAQQLWKSVEAILGSEVLSADEETRADLSLEEDTTQLSCKDSFKSADELASSLKVAEQQAERSRHSKRWDEARVAYEEFLTHAQRALIDGNRSFGVLDMSVGIATCSLALLVCLYSVGATWPSGKSALTLASVAAYYGITLYRSTSERSEKSFWYLCAPVWIAFLAAGKTSRRQTELERSRIIKTCVKMLVFHFIAVYWTYLGPMIYRTSFPQHITVKWSVLLVAYGWNSINIVQHAFGRLMTKSAAVSLTVPLVAAAFIFKVSCEQERSHALSLPFVIDRTSLFRTLLVLTALATLTVCILVARKDPLKCTQSANLHSTLSTRLRHLLTLFLITQSRAENTPLFLVLEYQRTALQTLLQQEIHALPDSTPQRRTEIHDASGIDPATSVLVFSHTYFYCFGGSNSISSIDLSNAYNGITSYNVATVGMLLFSANWTGPIWWCSAACDLVPRGLPLSAQQASSSGGHQSADGTQMRSDADEKCVEGAAQRSSMPWLTYLSTLSASMASGVLVVMALCFVKREHSTVWTIWGSKYLYSVFWVLEWHLIVSLGLSSVLRALGTLG